MDVLIVENETLVSFEIKTIVTESGHRALGPATTMEQALAFAPQADIAFVDLGLDDGPDGGQLARRLIDRYGITLIFVTVILSVFEKGLTERLGSSKSRLRLID